MVRYLLDTNILAFLVSGDSDSISDETKEILSNYQNLLFVSSISIIELLQLFRIRKIQPKAFKDAHEMYHAIEGEFFIKIIPFAKEHLTTLSKLQIPADHNDPFDHAIIAQALSEKMTLVSSDKKFKEYVSQQLSLAFNKR
jgi:PIN domain nuclease of toxin-antitoxin system